MNNADLYAIASDLQKRDAEDALAEGVLKMKWGSDEVVADLGSGDGYVTATLLPKYLPSDFARLVGFDKSDEMVKYANKNHRRDQRLSFVRWDVTESIPKSMLGVFTKIVSLYCLHWVLDQRKVAQIIRDLLARGGEALLVLLASNPIFELWRAMAADPHWGAYMKDVHKHISPYHGSADPAAEFQKHLNDAGLHADCCCRQKTFNFKSREKLRNQIKAVNPFQNEVPANMQEAFIDACMKKVDELGLTSHNNNDADSVTIAYSLLEVHAWKPLEPCLSTIKAC